MEKIDFLNCDEFKLIKELMKLSDNDKTEFTLDIRADDPNLEISSEGITYKRRRVILYIRATKFNTATKQTNISSM